MSNHEIPMIFLHTMIAGPSPSRLRLHLVKRLHAALLYRYIGGKVTKTKMSKMARCIGSKYPSGPFCREGRLHDSGQRFRHGRSSD